MYQSCTAYCVLCSLFKDYPANIYFLKVNIRNTKKRCKICLKVTIKTPEQRH